jgi:hypothetical protein
MGGYAVSDIATLDEVKEYLRYPPDNTDDDDLIQVFMDSADNVVRRYCGEIISAKYDEWHQGGNTLIQLRHFPVKSVDSITENWGFFTYVLTEQPGDSDPSVTSLWAFSLDYPGQGLVTRRSVGNIVIPFINTSGGENIHVSYTTGVDVIPGNVKHGWLDLIAHWWQNSQQRSIVTTSSGVSTYDGVGSAGSPNWGVPNRIVEILTGARRTPIIG